MKRFHLTARIATAFAALAGSSSMCALAAPVDGAIDTTFGTNGRTVIGFDTLPANPIDVVLDTIVDSFNRIYLVGVVNTSAGQRIGIARLRADGTLDTNYGPDDVGLVVAPEQLGFTLTGVSTALDPSGRLLVGGTLNTAGNEDFAICRFSIDGALTAFPNGLQCVSVPFDLGQPSNDVLRAIAVQPDGKIVMAGSSKPASNFNRAAFARLDTSGDLDTSFNDDGKLTFTGSYGYDDFKLYAVKIAANGKIVAAGEGRDLPETFSEVALVRILENGTLDSDFALNGVARRLVTGSPDARLRDFVFVPPSVQGQEQSMIAVGEIETAPGSGTYDGLVVGFSSPSGNSSAFGGDGFFIDTTGAALAFNGVQREDNGNLTIVGTIRANTNPSTTLDYYITRYLANGTRDTANFNPGVGFRLVDFLQPGGNDIANAVAFQSDRIVIAGASLVSVGPPANLDFSAVALLRDRIFANGVD